MASEGWKVAYAAQPPESRNLVAACQSLNTAPPACPPQNLWSARCAGSSAGHGGARAAFQRCCCLSYGSSGCENPLRSPTHTCFSNKLAAFRRAVPVPRPAPRNVVLCRSSSGQVEFGSTRPPRRCDRSSRHPFRVCSCARHHPLTRTRPFNCLAEETPCPRRSSRRLWGAGFAWSYLGHSHQSAAFQTPADSPAPDTTPAATLLARLFLSFTTAVTSVGRLRVRAHQACPRLPPRHSFQSHCGTDFREQNTEAFPYPPWSNVTHPAPSLLSFTGKGLTPLSSLSCSRFAFSQRNPGGCRPPVPRCCHREAPDASVR